MQETVVRESTCLMYAKKLFPKTLSRLFIAQNTKEEFEKLQHHVTIQRCNIYLRCTFNKQFTGTLHVLQATEIADYISKPIVDRIRGSDWMDEDTIEKLIDKVLYTFTYVSRVRSAKEEHNIKIFHSFSRPLFLKMCGTLGFVSVVPLQYNTFLRHGVHNAETEQIIRTKIFSSPSV